MKYAPLFFAAVLALSPFPAFAKGACYTPEQLQAEQALRLHSELMVIAVGCHQGSGGENLITAYGDFTKKNIHTLHEAEQTMIAYYHGSVDRLDRLRTRLANEFGQKSANMSSGRFCTAYRDKVLTLDAASPADVQNEVERMKISDHSYVKLCGEKTVVARKTR